VPNFREKEFWQAKKFAKRILAGKKKIIFIRDKGLNEN
jgi:hypothetical protein